MNERDEQPRLPRSRKPKGRSWPLLKRVIRDFVLPFWPSVLLVMFFTVLIAAAAGMYPLVIKWTFDGLQAKDAQVLFYAPLAVLLAATLKGLAALMQILVTNRTATRIEVAMQERLFHHLMDADVLGVTRESPGQLVQRFNGDIGSIRDAVTRLVTVVFRDIATAAGVIAWMLYADWQLTLVLFAVIPFATWPTLLIGRRMREVALAAGRASGGNTAAIIEALAAPRLAKLYQLEPHLKERASWRFNTIRSWKIKAANYRSLMQPILEVAGGAAVAGVLYIIAQRIIGGATTVGDFIAFITGLIMAAQPLSSIGNFHVLVQEALASVERYYMLIDRLPTVVDAPDATPLVLKKGSISVRNLSFAYRKDRPAINDLSIEIEGGKVTALVGRSGSGKSTLFGLLPRLFDPDSGQIIIDGQDIRTATLASLREKIAVVSQDVVLYDSTVEQNIAFGKLGATEPELQAAADAASASGFIEALPHGWKTMVGAQGDRLSGGQRQRISIARAFLKNAPILCLDEATSALDAESEAAIQTAMARLMKGRTVVIIAHRLSTVRSADKIIVMDEGRVEEQGTHRELMALGGLYANLYALQFGETQEAVTL